MSLTKAQQKRISRVCATLRPGPVGGYLTERAQLVSTMRELSTPEGKVWVEESGRDCDGVVYSGVFHLIPCHPLALEKLDCDIAGYADGPYHLSLRSVAYRKDTHYQSRDTFAEAAGY